MPNELADDAILIVDDRPENLLALEAVLQPFRRRLVRATSGDDALKRLLELDFATILMDVEMPGLDGFQTARLIRERERTRNIPILFLTAELREEADLVKAYAQGTVDYIVKPIDPDILRAKVRVLLELHVRGVRLKEQEELRRAVEVERDRLFLEERAARAEADYQQAQLRSLFMNAPFPLAMMKGAALVHELVNPPYRNLFGDRDLIGTTLREMPGLRGGALVEIIENVFRTGETFVNQEFALVLDRRGYGELEDGYFNLVVQPVRGPNEQITGVLVFGSDVTDQVLNRRKVEDAVRVRDDFLSIASHELKTPLTPLELKVDSLLRQAEENLEAPVPAERIARDLQVAQRQIRKLTELINELLDDSRISAGRLQLSIEEVNLSQVVEEVVARFHHQALQAGCPIHLAIVGEAVTGRWDPLRIEQVVTNLLTNALK
ncbi:MAG TPA: response regulator, partial [Myxococcaceae bacterium]|nr:response regulator [Myxococcaceae bacterium]